MATPFKMKGFSGFGGSSPLRAEKLVGTKDVRSTGRKWWDKATQIGMGIVGGIKGFTSEPVDQVRSNPYSYPFRDTIEGAKGAYKKEKRHDIAKGTKGVWKKTPTKKKYTPDEGLVAGS